MITPNMDFSVLGWIAVIGAPMISVILYFAFRQIRGEPIRDLRSIEDAIHNIEPTETPLLAAIRDDAAECNCSGCQGRDDGGWRCGAGELPSVAWDDPPPKWHKEPLRPIPAVSYLNTDYGCWICPRDLVRLWEAAPKRRIWVADPELTSEPYRITVVDSDTEAGAAFYAREAELVKAIDTVCAAGFIIDDSNMEESK